MVSTTIILYKTLVNFNTVICKNCKIKNLCCPLNYTLILIKCFSKCYCLHKKNVVLKTTKKRLLNKTIKNIHFKFVIKNFIKKKGYIIFLIPRFKVLFNYF